MNTHNTRGAKKDYPDQKPMKEHMCHLDINTQTFSA